METYVPRIVDAEIDELFEGLAAISLDGPKAVGKTETARRRVAHVLHLDDESQRSIIAADPQMVRSMPKPLLIDEWQRVPAVWDVVRRAVDEDATPRQYMLTGSAGTTATLHSGAGRIVRVRMRPMSVAERVDDVATVSLAAMLTRDTVVPVEGQTDLALGGYVEMILESGFPGIRPLSGRVRRAQLDGYLDRIVDRDFEEQGVMVRKPDQLRRWMTAYAAASSTTATYETIRNAATAGTADKPAKTTTIPYRETLERLFILDEVPAWMPAKNYMSRLTRPPKHQLADPALAARLLGIDAGALLSGASSGPVVPRDGNLLGHLFESLVIQSLRIYAQAAEARVFHMRTMGERHEVDSIVERADGRFIAVEVKLSTAIKDADTAHLNWLKAKAGDDMLDAVVINTGSYAYRRKDGVAVVPAALFGP